MLIEELNSMELPAETAGYRLEEKAGAVVALEKRRNLTEPGARLYVGELGEDIPGDIGMALRKIDAGRIIAPGAPVAIKINLGGGVRWVPSSYSDLLVVEGVIDEVRRQGGRPFICEANMRTLTMDLPMLVHRGLYPLLVRKDVPFINLSELPGIDFYPLGWERPITLARPLLHPEVKIVSVPALKHHWECGVTLSAKNMYGAIAERQKSLFHRGGVIDETVAAAARAIDPDISVLAHRQVGGGLGPHLCVPINFGYVLVSDNMLAADRAGCDVLGADWRKIKHIQINCGGREIPYTLVEGSIQIDPLLKQRIAKTAISRAGIWFWRCLLYPQYFVPHSTQFKHLFRIEPLGTLLNWLLFHPRGDYWPSRWRSPRRRVGD